MQRIIHYFDCAIKLIIIYIRTFFGKWILFIQKSFKVIRCVYLLYLKKYDLIPEECIYEKQMFLETVKEENSYKQRMYDLSIIIPVYNVEIFIEECLESILKQESKYRVEIIIVDDGSKDKTVDIIKSKFNDSRIKLIHQENMGQSVARNKAISLSQGKYIMFVDGDDILIPYAIENMMNEAYGKNADIVEGDIVSFQDNISEKMIKESKTKYHIESNEINPDFVLTCYGYSVAKVYRAELWETLRFPEGFIFEDVITKFILRRKANKVVFLGDVVYGYRRNLHSSSHGNNNIKLLDSISVFPHIEKLCYQEGIPFDNVFYMLSLNHIGLLNFITLKNQSDYVKDKCFLEMKKQLVMVNACNVSKLPFMFKLLEKAILDGKMEAWQYIADTIIKFGMLKKWREIN